MPAPSLSARDYLVLWYAWQQRFMSLRQYGRLFWPQASQRAARDRLDTLRTAGLLTAERFQVGRDRTLYLSTRQGNKSLVEAGLLEPALATDYRRRKQDMTLNLDHDLRVTDLRIALEESGAIPLSWISDHQLRQTRGSAGPYTRFPDGLFEWEAGGVLRKGLLEFENSWYNRDRWPKILLRLRANYGDRHVFMVCRTPERVLSATAAIHATKVFADKPQGLCVAAFPDVDQKGLNAGFRDLEGRLFEAGACTVSGA